MNKRFYKILPYLFAIALIIIIFYWLITENALALFKQVQISNIILTVLITAVFFFVNGIQFAYNVSKSSEIKLPLSEYVNIPILMNLFSYIFPLNGGMIFASFYLKGKYKVAYSGGLASSAITLIFSLFITGISVFVYVMFSQHLSYKFYILCVLFLLPVFTWTLFLKIKKREAKNIFWRILNLIISTAEQLKLSLKEKKVWLLNVAFTLLSISVNTLWFYSGVIALGYHFSIFQTFILTLLLRIATQIKLLPGNLGFQEIILGLIISATGHSIQDGIIISLYLRACTLCISLFYGIPLFLQNKKYLTKLRLLS